MITIHLAIFHKIVEVQFLTERGIPANGEGRMHQTCCSTQPMECFLSMRLAGDQIFTLDEVELSHISCVDRVLTRLAVLSIKKEGEASIQYRGSVVVLTSLNERRGSEVFTPVITQLPWLPGLLLVCSHKPSCSLVR